MRHATGGPSALDARAAGTPADDPAPAARPLVLRGLVTMLVVVALGVPVGLAWSALAPKVGVVGDGSGGAYYVDAEDRGFLGSDLVLGGLALLAGALVAVALLMLDRRRAGGPRPPSGTDAAMDDERSRWPERAAGLLGAVAGGALAALLAVRVGKIPGPASVGDVAAHLRDGERGSAPLTLRAHGVAMLWPWATAVVWVVREAVRVPGSLLPSARPADLGGAGGGQGHQVGGGELDVQTSPAP